MLKFLLWIGFGALALGILGSILGLLAALAGQLALFGGLILVGALVWSLSQDDGSES